MVYPFGPLKRENRLSAVPTDQAGRTVARLITRLTLRENSGSVNTMPPILQINLWTHSLDSWLIIAINGHHVDIKTKKEALQQIE